MRVAVAGLWHLGTVMSACLASGGHDVVGIDADTSVIDGLENGRRFPVDEPGLQELTAAQKNAGRLRFSTDFRAVADREIVCIAYDTPVDDLDRADVEFVIGQVDALLAHATPGTLVLISSQLPVGSTARLEGSHRGRGLTFAYSPENLRLGKAIQVFTQPDRVVIGARSDADRARLQELFEPFTNELLWMSVESAEMTKHALNAFLATSVAFINEIASLSELVGADAQEVERGLKTDIRIGPRAYIHPGPAFAGGTLARDIAFLQQTGARHQIELPLFHGVRASNDLHKGWLRRALVGALGAPAGKTLAVLGLTYKAGTNTLRRSGAIEACQWLTENGASVRAHDPAVSALPADLASKVKLFSSPQEAVQGADAVVIATEWPQFRSVTADDLVSRMRTPVVFDAARFLEKSLPVDDRIEYYSIGKVHDSKRSKSSRHRQ
ncbi:MAG: nucleotide sugar dehydrogenase [Bryobacteraceae bacterium]